MLMTEGYGSALLYKERKTVAEGANGNSREQGQVKWFNDQKGYGFIAVNGMEADIFVHYTSIQSKGFKSLKEGDTVEFIRVKTPKGFQANEVTVLQ